MVDRVRVLPVSGLSVMSDAFSMDLLSTGTDDCSAPTASDDAGGASTIFVEVDSEVSFSRDNLMLLLLVTGCSFGGDGWMERLSSKGRGLGAKETFLFFLAANREEVEEDGEEEVVAMVVGSTSVGVSFSCSSVIVDAELGT